jgi:hypothetical protein
LRPGREHGRVKTTEKLVLSSIPGDGVCSSEIKHYSRTALRSELLVSARGLQAVRSQNRKLFLVRGFMKFGLAIIIIFCMISGTYQFIRPAARSRTINIDKKCRHCRVTCSNSAGAVLVEIKYKNPVRTAKKTPHFTVTKINRLTLFKEIIAVCSENHTKHKYKNCSVTGADC